MQHLASRPPLEEWLPITWRMRHGRHNQAAPPREANTAAIYMASGEAEGQARRLAGPADRTKEPR